MANYLRSVPCCRTFAAPCSETPRSPTQSIHMRCSARFDLSQAGANKRWLPFLTIGSRLKGWNIMPTNIDELLPTARDILRQSALKEAEKAEEAARHAAAAE